jgi:2-polyprenyl-3-methyl-5-hydroxy-6-metoxy-1,4-benzoquinol methylase
LSQPNPSPSPALFFQTINGFQQSEALRTAIQLELFTAIAAGAKTPEDIGAACKASPRGIRSLCDYLVVLGFLTKSTNQYALTPDSALFLDSRSPAYLGSATKFLLSPRSMEAFQRLTEAVRKGGTALEQHSLGPDNPLWVDFARNMAPLMRMPSEQLATMLKTGDDAKTKVLSLAAGHGLFEIAIARQNSHAEVWAVDWVNVLSVAQENAAAAGVAARYHTIPGSALDVNFGTDYDLVIMANFISHFDPTTVEGLLHKVHASLKATGRAVVMAFIPDEDRVTPPMAAGFGLIMLATTPSGDAYTFSEYQNMFRNAGFSSIEQRPLPPTFFSVVIATK